MENLTNDNPVKIQQEVQAPAAKIWQALTDKDQMKQWYFDLSDFRAEIGFHFSFPGQGSKGEKYIHHCTITEVVPEQRLQYSWAYEGYPGYSLVTFELAEIENGTQVTLTHQGLETFPQDLPDFARSSFNQGWTELIGKLLPQFLEGVQ